MLKLTPVSRLFRNLFVGLLLTAIFVATSWPVRADFYTPYGGFLFTNSSDGPLVVPQGLSSLDACYFTAIQQTGYVPGPVNVSGSNNGGTTWTSMTIEDAAGNTQAQPFTTVNGTKYGIYPLYPLMKITPDSSWNAGTQQAFLSTFCGFGLSWSYVSCAGAATCDPTNGFAPKLTVPSPSPTASATGCGHLSVTGSYPYSINGDFTSCASGGGGSGGSPAFAIIQANNAAVTGSTTPSVTFVKAATAGNTLLCVLLNQGSGSITAPTGYSLLFSKGQSATIPGYLYVYAKTAAGGETSVSPAGGTYVYAGIGYMEISGSHTLDQSSTSGYTSTGSVGLYAPQPITPRSGSLLLTVDAYGSLSGQPVSAQMYAANWFNVYAPTTTTQINLWVYNGAGAGASIAPSTMVDRNIFSSGYGVPYATFSLY